MIEVLLGIVVALGISSLVLPDRAKVRLRDGLAQQFLLLGAVFDAVMTGFRGAPAENLAKLWKDADLDVPIFKAAKSEYAQLQ